MGRVYEITSGALTVTAADELLQLKSSSSKVNKILSIKVTQSSLYGDANADGIRVTVSRVANANLGTGGTAITPRPCSPGDSAWGAGTTAGTVLAQNTTEVTGGNLTNLINDGMNVQAGFIWNSTWKTEIEVAPLEGLVIRLEDAPTASSAYYVQMEVEELG